MIKGAGMRSLADTLVERTTNFVALAATTKTVVESLAAAVNGEPAVMRKNDDLRPRPRDARAQNLH